MISFIRYSKQPYWPGRDEPKPSDDDIMVGDYDGDGGGLWEFAIRQHIFGTGHAAVRVEMFQDSVQALAEPLVVSAIRALKGCRTLDDAELRLSAAGILPKPGK